MLLLGHRGCTGQPHISQNSEAAFAEALQAADGFETDAVCSKDGSVFLIHANSRHGGIAEHLDADSAARIGARRMDELSDYEITNLRLQHGESVPTLQRALEMVGGDPAKVINIELKGFGVAEGVLALLREAFRLGLLLPSQVLVSSFDHTALAVFRHAVAELKIGALCVSAAHDGEEMFPWLPYKVRYAAVKAAAQSRVLRELQPDYFIMPEKLLTMATAEAVGGLHPQAKLCGWTVTEDADHDAQDLLGRLALLADKVGAIIADDPRGFAQRLRNR